MKAYCDVFVADVASGFQTLHCPFVHERVYLNMNIWFRHKDHYPFPLVCVCGFSLFILCHASANLATLLISVYEFVHLLCLLLIVMMKTTFIWRERSTVFWSKRSSDSSVLWVARLIIPLHCLHIVSTLQRPNTEVISNNKSQRRLAEFFISQACGHDVFCVIDCFMAPNRKSNFLYYIFGKA